MMRRPVSRPLGPRALTSRGDARTCRWSPRAVLAAAFATALLGTALVGTLAADSTVPPRVREVYVPFEHFQRICAEHPEGVVVELAEYRDLVERALRASGPEPEEVLPPVAAHIEHVRYEGQASESVARFTARIRAHSHRSGWVRCALGGMLPNAGRVQIDGEPGWLVVDRPADESYVLLSREGAHEITIEFTVALAEKDERLALEGRLLTAATAELELRVPGLATGTADPPLLRSEVLSDATIFRLPVGSARNFSIAWSRQKTLDENPVLLAAEHRLAFEPSPDNPRFRWHASVEIARRAVEALEFEEPEGLTILQISGDLVHSWSRRDNVVRVLLSAEHRGRVDLDLSGAFTLNDLAFTLRPPNLVGSYRNRGVLFVLAPVRERVRIDSTTGLRELDPSNHELPAAPEDPTSAAGGLPTIFRAYSFPGIGSEIRGHVEPELTRFESRASYVVSGRESSLTMDGLIRVQVLAGRLYDLTLDLPADWRVTRVAPGSQATAALMGDFSMELGPDRIVIRSRRALTPQQTPLELEVSLEDTAYSGERAWERRELSFVLPNFRGSERTRTDLGLALDRSLVLATTDLVDWRVLDAEESEALGMFRAPDATASELPRVVATLTTQRLDPRAQFVIDHRPSRGECRSVTHVVAAERAFRAEAGRLTIRVRTDLHLAIVDRALDELVILHPSLAADASVLVLGDDIKEVDSQPVSGRQRVRFARPWLGAKRLRLEYEIAHSVDEPVVFPEVQIEANFGHERFLVIQSQGSVEVTTAAGDGVTTVELDDVPDFAAPWDDARTLSAYRFRRGGVPGSFRTEVHERAPILGRLAREMTLHTMVTEDGTARTLAAVMLVYARDQSLRFTLPRGSKSLAATVDGEPVRALRSSRAKSGEIEYALPLPPRTHALVTILYEERGSALSAWGSWRGQAPRLLDLPVGFTQWHLYYPRGYRFDVRDGNVMPDDPGREQPMRTFAGSFFGRLLAGRLPSFQWLGGSAPGRDSISVPGFSADRLNEARAAWSDERETAVTSARIRPRSEQDADVHARAPRLELLPEGYVISVSKLGGDADSGLAFHRVGWDRFARAFVLLGTWLACASLLCVRRRSGLVKLILIGLFLGTVVPLAFGWDSSLLATPFCEALVTFAVAWGALKLARTLMDRWQLRKASAEATLGPTAWILMGTPLAWVALAQPVLAADTKATIPPPFDVVIVPYSPDAEAWPEPAGKAFLGKQQFLELWRKAYPDAPEPSIAPSPIGDARHALGNAEYRLELLPDRRYRLVGTVYAQLWTKEWVGLALPFDRAQLSRVLLDGAQAGIHTVGEHPVVEIRGEGSHRLDLELTGSVALDRGQYRIGSQILAGATTQVRAILPPDAELLPTKRGNASLIDSGATREVRLDLGTTSELVLEWSFPRVEGQVTSQRESVSYSELRLLDDGFAVRRRENLRIAGRPLSSVQYRILGDWQISGVDGPDLSEWTVSRAASGPLLVLNFSRPVASASLSLSGHARMAAEGALPTLELIDAVRQESYVGLFHGAGRRFRPEALAGLTRSSGQGRPEAPAGSPNDAPDRLHHAFGSGAGATLLIGVESIEQRLNHEAVAWVKDDRVRVYVRSLYASAESGGSPRHVVPLPASWDVQRVRGDRVRSWELREEAGGRALWIELTESAREGSSVLWSAEFALDPIPSTISLPPLSTVIAEAGVRREESCHWWIVCDEGLEPRSATNTPWESTERTAPTWLPLGSDTAVRLAFRTRRASEPLLLELSRSASRTAATIVAFARVGDDFVEVVSYVNYRVRGAGRDTYRLRLPRSAELVLLEVSNQRSRELTNDPSGTEITIRLQSPAEGEIPMTLRYRVPRPPGAPPLVEPVNLLDGPAQLADVDHYIAVVQTQRSFTLAAKSDGLHTIEVEALPYLPGEISPNSLGPAYRATRADWTLSLEEQEIEVADGPAAVIKLAELATIVGHDGTRRTEVIYTLLNRRLQFLTIELPKTANLWGVTVNGRPVAVGRPKGSGSAGVLHIPVERLIGSTLPLEVSIVYEEPRLDLPAYGESATLVAPEIPTEQAVGVHESIWSVQFPSEYTVEEVGNRMRAVPPSLRAAEKLRALLEQQEELVEATQNYTSRRSQEQAAQQLARISQALGDNLAELQDQNRSHAEVQQQERLGAQNLEMQWLDNDRLLDDTRKARTKLENEIRTNSDRAAAESTPDEQSFADRTQFLFGRGWRRGSQHRDSMDSAQGASVGSVFSALDSLLDGESYSGVNRVQIQTPATTTQLAEPVGIDPSGGLLPLPDAVRPTAGSVFEPSRTRPGYTTFTFQRSGADATLDLEFSRPGLGFRILAWLSLIIFAAISALRWRERLQNHP